MEALLKKEIDVILKKIGEDTVNKLKVYVRQYWYNRYTPKDYERTYSFLESISYRIERNTVEIYFDEEKFDHIFVNDGWGVHVGFDGDDFGSGLIEFIENGTFDSGNKGSLTNPRVGDHSGAIEKTKKWLDKYVKDEVKKQLQIGLNIKVT